MKILIVEDNHGVAETITDYLELDGHIIDCAYHGQAALKFVAQQHYDVIIMDVMMPKLDGITTVTKLRQELFCATPILFLTAKDQLEDKVAAYQAGGDDYLVKPFAMQELNLRLQALNSRGSRKDIGELIYADISVDTKTHKVTRAGQVVKLSATQLKILLLLLKKAPAIVTRQEIIDSIWGDESPCSDALRSHVYGLRTALNKGFEESRLETLHGKGYRIIA